LVEPGGVDVASTGPQGGPPDSLLMTPLMTPLITPSLGIDTARSTRRPFPMSLTEGSMPVRSTEGCPLRR
jgi:hypothetical protein